jgi:hypothetical protein
MAISPLCVALSYAFVLMSLRRFKTCPFQCNIPGVAKYTSFGSRILGGNNRQEPIQLQYHASRAVCSPSVSVIYSVRFDVLLILLISAVHNTCTNLFHSFYNCILSVVMLYKKREYEDGNGGFKTECEKVCICGQKQL